MTLLKLIVRGCAAVLMVALPLTAQAQTVRGRVSTSDGAVARGATVLLLDSAGDTRGGAFVDTAGAFSILAPSPGRYLLEVQRIGLQNTRSAPFSITAGQTLEIPITVSVEAIALPELQAIGKSRCGKASDARVATVWAEARKALQAAALTTQSALYRFQIRRHYRRLAVPSLRVAHDSSTIQESVHSGSPFASLAADSLIRYGFIQEKTDGVYYNAPDAKVLLSATFADAFCFILKGDADANLIGLSFEPVRRNVQSSISGTLWIDRASSELRFLEYSYVGSAVQREARGLLGGRIDFKRLPGGPWYVDKWYIRMPLFSETELPGMGGARMRRIVLNGIAQQGAEVMTVLDRNKAVVAIANPAQIQATLTDSATGMPLVGATVFLVGTRYQAVTSERGVAHLGGLPAGQFELSYAHPLLLFNQHIPTAVAMTIEPGARIVRAFSVPAHGRLPACRPGGAQADRAVLAGTARDELTDAVLPGAQVAVSWLDVTRTATTDSAGRFAICGLPLRTTLSARVSHLQRNGAPVTIDSIGHLGFRTFDIILGMPANPTYALSPLEVVGRPADQAARRARGTRADLLTREEIARLENRALHVGDLVKQFPSLRVRVIRHIGGAMKGVCVESMRSQMELRNAACNSVMVVVDGAPYNPEGAAAEHVLQMLLDLSPNMLESVEYLTSAEAGPRYGTGSKHGALVIYTRGNGPYAKTR